MTSSLSLFKHLGINAFHESIAFGKIRFRNPVDVVDPFSRRIKDVTKWNEPLVFDFIKMLNDFFIENLFNPKEIEAQSLNKDYRKLVDFIIQKMLSKIGTSSFVSDPYNFRLWSSLAQRPHRGVCLQFNPLNEDEVFNKIIKVSYSNTIPVFEYTRDKNDFFSILLGSKSWHFAEEEEYILYSRKAGFNSFKQESLVSIIFGCLVMKDEIDNVVDALKHNDYKHIILKQVVLKDDSYDFEIKEI